MQVCAATSPGVTSSATSNYQTRESPDEDGLICRNLSPNIPIKNSLTEISMLTPRNVLVTALAAPAILRLGTRTAPAATTLKVSHQSPSGTGDNGDFRDRLCRVFAAEVAKRSG